MKQKKKSPMELETGEELYEYLQGKSDEEIDDYFVSRGADIRDDGIMLNNGLHTLYRIEKEHRESLKDEKKSKHINKGDDGRGGR